MTSDKCFFGGVGSAFLGFGPIVGAALACSSVVWFGSSGSLSSGLVRTWFGVGSEAVRKGKSLSCGLEFGSSAYFAPGEREDKEIFFIEKSGALHRGWCPVVLFSLIMLYLTNLRTMSLPNSVLISELVSNCSELAEHVRLIVVSSARYTALP